MKSAFLLLLAAILLGWSVWFFYQSGDLLSTRDYLAGLLHVFVGFATVRAGVELARLAIISHSRSP